MGKLQLATGFETIFPGVLEANGFEMLRPNFDHYRTVITLAPHHRDPFDRLIIAQAQTEGLTIITSDPHFQGYGVPLLW